MNFVPLQEKLKKLLAVFGPPAKPSCSVCGRPLYSMESIARGMGKVCSGRHTKKDTRTIDMFEETSCTPT